MPIWDRDWYRNPNYRSKPNQSQPEGNLTTCPTCKGEGRILGAWAQETGGRLIRCPSCQGYGRIRSQDRGKAQRDIDRLLKEARDADPELEELKRLAAREPKQDSQDSIETVWERASRERIRYAKRLAFRRSALRVSRTVTVSIALAVSLGFGAHWAYYLSVGLSTPNAAKAVLYDWTFYADQARSELLGIFRDPNLPLSPTPIPPTVATPEPTSMPLPTAAPTQTPAPTMPPTLTPIPTPSPALPTPTASPAPASTPPATPTPTKEQIDSAIEDYVNGRISRETAVGVLGEEMVARLDNIFPHLRGQ